MATQNFDLIRDDISVLRKKTCQGNLKILPEHMFYPFGEKNWKQMFKCSSNRKEQRVQYLDKNVISKKTSK